MQAILRLKKTTPISEEGLGQPLANAIDYVMTTAQSASIVSLSRVSSLSREFAVPKQNTSRRLLHIQNPDLRAGGGDRLFPGPDEQREAWIQLQGAERQEVALLKHIQVEPKRRALLDRTGDTSPAPAPTTDYTILDAVVQLTVLYP